jgi:hypothetical protein
MADFVTNKFTSCSSGTAAEQGEPAASEESQRPGLRHVRGREERQVVNFGLFATPRPAKDVLDRITPRQRVLAGEAVKRDNSSQRV